MGTLHTYLRLPTYILELWSQKFHASHRGDAFAESWLFRPAAKMTAWGLDVRHGDGKNGNIMGIWLKWNREISMMISMSHVSDIYLISLSFKSYSHDIPMIFPWYFHVFFHLISPWKCIPCWSWKTRGVFWNLLWNHGIDWIDLW